MSGFYMLYPNNARKALTLSYDDGVEQDLRLISVMNAHGLKGTFNLNSGIYAPEGTVYAPGTVHRRLTRAAVTENYAASGQEVAIHTYTHPNLLCIPREAAIREVMLDRETLEAQFGHIVRGMAYPFGLRPGRAADELADTLRGCGVAYSRTTVSTEGFDLPQDWLQWNPTCHHNNPRLMELARDFCEREVKYQPILFYLWGHSYEFEGNDNWQVIENFASFIGGRGDIWYATNIELYEYISAYRSLVSSADGRQVFNPTSVTVHIHQAGRAFVIASGQTVTLD